MLGKFINKFNQLKKSDYFKLLILFFAAIKLVSIPLSTADLHVWVAQGLGLLSSPHLLSTDISSIHHLVLNYPCSLSSLLLGLVYNFFGDGGLLLSLRFFLFFFLGFFVALRSLKEISVDFKWLLMGIISMIGSEFMVDRPAIMALPFLWFFVHFLQSIRTKERIHWVRYFILISLWTNIHPSSIITLPLILYIMGVRGFNKRIFLALMLGLIAQNMTPIGFGIWKYSFDTIMLSNTRHIQEWSSIFHFYFPSYALLYLGTLSVTLYLLIKHRKLMDCVRSPYFPLMIIGLWDARHILFLFIFLLPLYKSFNLIKDHEDTSQKITISEKISIPILMGLLCYLLSNNPMVETGIPQIDLNRDKWGKRVFSLIQLSGHISASTANQSKVFIDSRNIIFNDTLFKSYLEIIKGRDKSLELLDHYAIDTLYLPVSYQRIQQNLSASNQWRKEFEDSSFVMWKRK